MIQVSRSYSVLLSPSDRQNSLQYRHIYRIARTGLNLAAFETEEEVDDEAAAGL